MTIRKKKVVKATAPATAPAAPVAEAVAVAMAIPMLPASRIGKAGSVIRQQVVSVYGATVADYFNNKGHEFIAFRTSPGANKKDRKISGQVMGLLKAGKLAVSPELQQELFRQVEHDGNATVNVLGATVAPAELAILLMGRYTSGTSKDGYNETSKISDSLANWMLHNVCPDLGMETLYFPHSKSHRVNKLAALKDNG